MTFLAVSTNRGDLSSILEAEYAGVAALMESGVLQTIWLKADQSGAVMVLTSGSRDAALAAIGTLPSTAQDLTDVELTEIVDPYAS